MSWQSLAHKEFCIIYSWLDLPMNLTEMFHSPENSAELSLPAFSQSIPVADLGLWAVPSLDGDNDFPTMQWRCRRQTCHQFTRGNVHLARLHPNQQFSINISRVISKGTLIF